MANKKEMSVQLFKNGDNMQIFGTSRGVLIEMLGQMLRCSFKLLI